MSDAIAQIAARLPQEQRHVPFMRVVLGWSYVECAYGSKAFEGVPLTEDAMRYIAAHWTPEGER